MLVGMLGIDGKQHNVAAHNVLDVYVSDKQNDDPDVTIVEVVMAHRHKLTIRTTDYPGFIRNLGKQSIRRN